MPALLALAVLLGWGLWDLPPIGHGSYRYTRAADRLSARARTPEAVNFVVFDLRAVDTMGEEFIFFASVAGVAVLLRRDRRERERGEGEVEREDPLPPSDPVRMVGFVFAAAAAIFGIDLVFHGHLTPGGGFQGGAVIAGAGLTVFVSAGHRRFSSLTPEGVVDMTEAVGAALYPVIGAVGLILGTAFLANVFPLGTVGRLLSAGTIPALDLAVGVEVGSGFLLLTSEFFDQVLYVSPER